jgi:hypothetical protein
VCGASQRRIIFCSVQNRIASLLIWLACPSKINIRYSPFWCLRLSGSKHFLSHSRHNSFIVHPFADIAICPVVKWSHQSRICTFPLKITNRSRIAPDILTHSIKDTYSRLPHWVIYFFLSERETMTLVILITPSGHPFLSIFQVSTSSILYLALVLRYNSNQSEIIAGSWALYRSLSMGGINRDYKVGKRFRNRESQLTSKGVFSLRIARISWAICKH